VVWRMIRSFARYPSTDNARLVWNHELVGCLDGTITERVVVDTWLVWSYEMDVMMW